MRKSVILFVILSIIVFLFSAFQTQKVKAKKVLIVVADKDFDDMEFAIAYGRLKAAGLTIDIASPGGGIAQSNKSIEVQTDFKISDVDEKEYASLFLVGCNDVSPLYENTNLIKLCKTFNISGKVLAAQGFSPIVFFKASILQGKKASVWPTESKKMETYGAIYSKDIITKAGNIITGMGGSDENFTKFTKEYIDLLNNNKFIPRSVSIKQHKDIDLQLNEWNEDYWFVMTHNDKTRTGLIYIPLNYDGEKAFSLIFALHGMGGYGKNFLHRGFNQLAGELDFIIVYPDGYNGDWDIIPGRETSIDDAGYFRILIKKLKKKFNIDPSRVYVTGHSLGGFMTYRLAYDLSEEITAAAPASGLVYLPHVSNRPKKPVSILHLHSVDDWNVLFTGEKLYESPLSVMSGLSFWKKRNKITGDGKVFFDRNAIKGTIWSNIENKVDVAMLISPKGGHTWLPYATEQVSEFFYNHPARENSLKINYKSFTTYNQVDKKIIIDTIVQNENNIKKVIFFTNGDRIGDDNDFPFSISWKSKSPGIYRLTAIAELNTGELIHSTSNEYIWVTKKDLAYNETAYSSSIESEEMIAKNAFDGNIFTRWASAYKDPQWIEVDLRNIKNISGITLIWENAYASSYDIQISVDHNKWKTVYSKTKATGGTEFISFDPVNARYIRMYGRKRATQWGYSIWDFMVHGE